MQASWSLHLTVLEQVQNGVAVYATWGTLSTLLSLTTYLQHQTETLRCDCAMLSLLLLLMELLAWWVSTVSAPPHPPPPHTGGRYTSKEDLNRLCLPCRFLLENFYLDEHVRYIVTIYPVVILWLTGILSNSDYPESPVYIFAGTVCHFNFLCAPFIHPNLVFNLLLPSPAFILAISCMVFVARVAMVTWRHHKQPLYSDSRPSLSPVEIALTQSKLFLWIWVSTDNVRRDTKTLRWYMKNVK